MEFSLENDKLIWKKLITIYTLDPILGYPISRDGLITGYFSTHFVSFYKTRKGVEYYYFEYIDMENNGRFVDNYSNEDFECIGRQIPLEGKLICCEGFQEGRVRLIRDFTV
ncbi:hypothetical protein QYB59_000021 [Clostridium perfringens]|nr:hypothetical protein [Clostridium perfringens]